jgi:hypothetical protein
VDNLFDFLKFPGFNFGANASIADARRRDVEAFLLAFDTGMAPAVGAQITFDLSNRSDAASLARLDTLKSQASATSCDLIAKGRVQSLPRGWVYIGGDHWKSDIESEAPWSTADLLSTASAGHELTITGVPPNTGTRMGIDRDRDGFLDADEILGGGDPADPSVVPNLADVPRPVGGLFALRSVAPNPFSASTSVSFTLGRASRVDVVVTDVLGRRVRSVAHGLALNAGPHALAWDGARDDGGRAGAGVYFVTLTTEGGTWNRPVVRIR